MKIIFDRSKNKLEDHQLVLCTKRPDLRSSKVTNAIRAMLFNIGFVPRHPSNTFDVLPVIRLKSYVSVEVDD